MNNLTPQKSITVVAMALYHPLKNLYLIVRRNALQTGAGFWEFPGGKVEDSETLEQALIREVQEELGVNISHAPITWWSENLHQYPNKTISLQLFKVTLAQDEFSLVDHDALAWVDGKSIQDYKLSEADQPFASLLVD